MRTRIGWTIIALALGRGGQAVLGLQQVAGFIAGGALAGMVFRLVARTDAETAASRYGPWACDGVTAMFTLVPLQALLNGDPIGLESSLFLRSPWMVVLYTTAGALGGYVAGHELGFLKPPWSPR